MIHLRMKAWSNQPRRSGGAAGWDVSGRRRRQGLGDGGAVSGSGAARQTGRDAVPVGGPPAGVLQKLVEMDGPALLADPVLVAVALVVPGRNEVSQGGS